MEQLRRTAAVTGSVEVLFKETMDVPISQERFLSNRFNKNRLIQMLLQKLQDVNITARQARDDADVLIIETAIEESQLNTTVVVGEDVDLVIILIGRTLTHQNIFFTKPGRGNIETKVNSSASINNFIHCKKKHIICIRSHRM